MSDDVVEAVLAELKSLAFANSVPLSSLYPFADAWVNMLRNSGMSDAEILRRLVPAASQPKDNP